MRILFCCTGNIFRSMSAEYCAKDYLKRNNINNIIVESAGTVATTQKSDSITYKTLESFGIDSTKHVQRKIDYVLAEKYDLIISMAKSHQEYLRDRLGIESCLFNEIAYGKKTSVDDVDEVIPDWYDHRKEVEAHIKKTVIYIHEAMPSLINNLKKFSNKK